jgi:hypothetical protein
MLLVAAIAVFALSIARARRRPVRDEGARIVARYRHLLVTADAIPALHRHPVVRVDSMRDLARLAKFHDELVVHADESGVHHFALFTDPVVYVFEIGTPVDAAASPLELAQWALAGLEAHAAKRRHQALRVPLRRHARAVPDKTVPDKVVQNTVVQNPVAPDNAAPDTLLPGKSASGLEVTADSTR